MTPEPEKKTVICLRPDVELFPVPEKGTLRYYRKAPGEGGVLELGEKEYILLRLLLEEVSLQDVSRRFNESQGLIPEPSQIKAFSSSSR